MECVERFQWTLSTPGLWWNPAEREYGDAAGKDHAQIVAAPHIIGVTRDVEVRRLGSWVGDLFNYHPPVCGFSRREQALLLLALHGATDEELASTLCVALTTVKKTWLSIYNRVTAHLPRLIADQSPAESSLHRGKEKRRRLLTYLRDHLEELRPFSAKLFA